MQYSRIKIQSSRFLNYRLGTVQGAACIKTLTRDNKRLLVKCHCGDVSDAEFLTALHTVAPPSERR